MLRNRTHCDVEFRELENKQIKKRVMSVNCSVPLSSQSSSPSTSLDGLSNLIGQAVIYCNDFVAECSKKGYDSCTVSDQQFTRPKAPANAPWSFDVQMLLTRGNNTGGEHKYTVIRTTPHVRAAFRYDGDINKNHEGQKDPNN
jgi:hypothetical protein